ncbi:Mitogen-activated protein kinase kinase kinase 1 [Nymphaea thermarum]|nr:Mitogen-activated protein kinase kinase kinase 1 [Nymphaea thermarum]
MEDEESSTAATAGLPLPRATARRRIADRIGRALQHRLLLLHRSAASPYSASFFVLGATGNVYTVTISPAPSCTCPDPTVPCKHILFVLLRVLRLSPSDRRLRHRSLRQADVRALLATDSNTAVLAGPKLRSRFQQIFGAGGAAPRDSSAEDRTEESDEEVCPVCLEKMERRREAVAVCVACRNAVHVACFDRWKKSRGRRGANCVMCRARWKQKKPEDEKYVNLEAFVKEECNVEGPP